MDHMTKQKRKPHPQEKANIFSVITFFYTLELFKKGWKKDLIEDDLYEVLPAYKSKKLGDQLEAEWEKQKKKGKHLSIFRLLWTCYGQCYFMIGLMQLIMKTTIILVQPYALGKLISYFNAGQTELTKADAYYYACLTIGICILDWIYIQNYYLILSGLGIRIRQAFCTFIYRKALKLSPSRLGDISIGKIVTLITKDVHTFEGFIHFANDLWIGFVKTAVISYITYNKIGVAALAGVGFFMIVIPFQICLGILTAKLRLKMCKKTDERLQATQESLSAIRIIKMYVWEKFFKNKIINARKKEIRSMHNIYYLTTIILQLGALNSKIAFYLLIMTYTWLGNHITAEVVYFIESCFQILTHTLSILFPLAVILSAELIASIKRIGNIMKALEIESTPQNDDATDKPKVILKDVSVTFKEKEILHSINLNIDTGITLITGSVGSGKSFLLKTILQDYELANGEVITHGRISYASQEPWLFPSSIKQNILFGEKYDEERYQKVLEVCALIYDFELLSAGDRTIVEDRGINFSKGQQTRINLARAVYKEADIYLLDDSLSALDAHVSDFIFNKCIKQFLQNKLVILVGHNVNHVKEVDHVIILHQGSVKSSLKSSEIVEKEFLKNLEETTNKEKYTNDNIDEDEDDEIASEETKLITETNTERIVYGEIHKKGEVDLSVYKKYITFGGGIFAFLIVLVLFGISQFAQSYGDKLLSTWVNHEQVIANFSIYNITNITEEIKITEKRDYVLRLYSTMIISAELFDLLRSFSLLFFVRRASIRLHKYMVNNIIGATMQFFDFTFIGNVLNRFSKDLGVVDASILFALTHMFWVLFSVTGIVIVIATVNSFFLLLAAILFTVLTCVRKCYIPTGRSLKRLDASTRSPVIGHLNATLEGLTTIRAFKAEQILRDEFDKHQDLYTSACYISQSSMRAFAYSLDGLSNIFTAIIVMTFVIFDNDIPAGFVGLAISQAFKMAGILQWGIRQWAELENTMTSVERVLQYTEVKQESKQGQCLENWPKKGEVKYQNVYLSYNNSKEYVLKNINFTANPQEKIGIVGRTGAGKSSIISTLFRLYDVEGTITIDNVDTKTLSLDFLRKHISIIPQDPVLFTGTIRDNIDPDREYTDDEIWKAIETAKLKKLVHSLDFEITESGANFSVGQRQLICLARAVIRNNKIIVLDEATSNMDAETDALIHETIQENFASCTVLTIAHKLHSIINADKVIVMDKGEIIEYDDPLNLLQNKDGIFYKMVQKSKLLLPEEKF